MRTKLKVDEQALLDVVIGVTGDNEKMIQTGVDKALEGTSDWARRTYLRNLLTRVVREKIRAAREKFAHA